MSWIQTFTGRKFYPLAPRPGDVCIEDIAHALSMKCRFGGHCKKFYSVAEHSVRVSRCLPADLALWGLMHDAGEAYLPDIGKPIKDAIHVGTAAGQVTFGQTEDQLLAVIAQALGFPPVDYEAVRVADLELLATEARDLMADPPEPWELGVEPLAEKISPLTQPEAERLFLARWEQLRGR